MPSITGFESLTPDGYRQLTYNELYFRLEQKNILGSDGWVADALGGPTSMVVSRTIFVPNVSMNDTPVAALSSATGTFAVVTAGNGGVNVKVYRMNGTPYQTVTLYVFSKRRPVDPGHGLAFYDEGGQITFSLVTPIIRPLGQFDETGYTGVSTAGRSCAHIPQRRGFGVLRNFRVGGLGSCSTTGTSGQQVQGYQTYYTDSYAVRFVACNGSSVSVDVGGAPGNEVPLRCDLGFTGAPAPSRSEQNAYRSLVIDVSGI